MPYWDVRGSYGGRGPNSMQSESNTAHQRSRIPGWVTISVILLAVAIIVRLTHDHSVRSHNPLQGNHEQAPAALAAVVQKLPDNAQLPYVLNLAGADHTRASEGLRYAIVDWVGQHYVLDPGKHRSLPEPTLQFLISFLHDEDSVVRTRAMEVIHQDTVKPGLYYLLCGLQDEDPWVAEDAGELLAQWMTRNRHNPLRLQLIPGLISGLRSRDSDVVQFATVTLAIALGNQWHVSRLASITKRDAITAKWLKWWKSRGPQWKTDAPFNNIKPFTPTHTDAVGDFYAEGVSGRALTNADLMGHVTLVNVWGMGCGPCIAEMPSFVQLYSHYRSAGLRVIGAAENGISDRHAILSWCRKNGIDYPQVNANRQVRYRFGSIEDVPVTLLFDKQGRVIRIWQGGPRPLYAYEPAITAALEGRI